MGHSLARDPTQTTSSAGCLPLAHQPRPQLKTCLQLAVGSLAQRPHPRDCRLAPSLAPLPQPCSTSPCLSLARPRRQCSCALSPPYQGAGSGRVLQWPQGSSSCRSSSFPAPPQLPPPAFPSQLCSSGPTPPAPNHGGLALGVPRLPRFLLGHCGPAR